jgi:hypothetical protein
MDIVSFFRLPAALLAIIIICLFVITTLIIETILSLIIQLPFRAIGMPRDEFKTWLNTYPVTLKGDNYVSFYEILSRVESEFNNNENSQKNGVNFYLLAFSSLRNIPHIWSWVFDD